MQQQLHSHRRSPNGPLSVPATLLGRGMYQKRGGEGGGSRTQKFVYQKQPKSIIYFVIFISPPYEIWVQLGEGRGTTPSSSGGQLSYPSLARDLHGPPDVHCVGFNPFLLVLRISCFTHSSSHLHHWSLLVVCPYLTEGGGGAQCRTPPTSVGSERPMAQDEASSIEMMKWCHPKPPSRHPVRYSPLPV